MPGIVGIITDGSPDVAKRELTAMLATLCHEKFYVAGTWSDESLGAYVGWVARKGSFSDRMPVCNERGDVVLVFSGEEYPEPGIRRRLKADGHALDPRDQDGPSYLPHLYEEDENFPAGLNGMFHGLTVDRRRGTATVFNDRYGMRRLYYHEAKNAFYFAAEAKAILAVRPELRRANPRALGEFVACGCVLENRTLFEGISVLPGASAWSFRGGVLERKSTYFRPSEWEEQPPLDPESYYRQIRSVFSQNLPRYFEGRKIGLALTGGLDTRLIMAWRKAATGTLPCYTFGSMFRENQDVRVARRISQLCGQPYEVIPTGHDFLSRFAEYAERSVYLTDGCLDLGRSADLYVSEKARQIAPVKVVGTYGSEVLTLIQAFAPKMPVDGVFGGDLSASIARARTTFAEIRDTHPVTFTVFRQTPWWHYGILALEETQLTVRSPFLDNDFIRTAYRTPVSSGPIHDVRRRLISDGDATLARVRTDRTLGEGANVLAATVFRIVLEFTFKAEYSYDYAMPQWLAQIDHLSPLHLERLFLGRHKVFHFRVWYRDALSAYVREMLLDDRSLSRPYVRRQAVEAVVRGHLKGNRNHTREIHKLLALELIHRLFVDSQ